MEEHSSFILFIMIICSIRKQGGKSLDEVASRSFPLGHSDHLVFLGSIKDVRRSGRVVRKPVRYDS